MKHPKEPLTIEKLKTFPGYEKKTEAELTEELESIQKMALIIVEFAAVNKNYFIDNQQVVYLNQQNNKAA